jgi:hypothetical protein
MTMLSDDYKSTECDVPHLRHHSTFFQLLKTLQSGVRRFGCSPWPRRDSICTPRNVKGTGQRRRRGASVLSCKSVEQFDAENNGLATYECRIGCSEFLTQDTSFQSRFRRLSEAVARGPMADEGILYSVCHGGALPHRKGNFHSSSG